MKRLESDLQKDILGFLKENKIWNIRYNPVGTWGIPDVLVLYKGFFIGIEIKREDKKGRATLLQLETIKSIKQNGGLAKIVDSVKDVENVIHAIFDGIHNHTEVLDEWAK